VMGYLDFFYLEANAFEIRTIMGFNGIWFAEWSRGTRAVMLGTTSVLWLCTTLEAVIKGVEVKDFYRST
jgi:hypothetical protein